MRPMPQPTVFVGCSTEHLETARALKRCLARHADVKVWDEGVLELNESTFVGLMNAASEFDFAVFVFDADDAARIRKLSVRIVRDNVLFEFGLFAGRMGRGRVFWMSARGARRTHLPTDLAGITHLDYEKPSSPAATALEDGLRQVSARLVAEMSRLGPRTDRTIETIDFSRILCVASSEYSAPKFAEDIEAIQRNVPRESIESGHGVEANRLFEYLSSNRWDIIHLAMHVDSESGDLIIPSSNGASGTTTNNRLPAAGVENLIEKSHARLVVIVTCDSLVLGARLARKTNVIAGHNRIDARAALTWSGVFYKFLAQGCPLSEAFNRAQELTDPGLLLLAKSDFRFAVARGDSERVAQSALA